MAASAPCCQLRISGDDTVEAPGPGNAFQLVFATFFELERGAGDEVLYRRGDEDLGGTVAGTLSSGTFVTPGKWMSCQTLVIRRDRRPSGGARGTPSWRQVTYVLYDPSFEMPDEGGPNERLTGDSVPGRVTPSQVQLAVCKLAQSCLF